MQAGLQNQAMAELHITDTLLGTPLFQGMSRNDLNEVIANTRIGFQKYIKNRTIIHEGDICKQLYFLLSGTITAERISNDENYTITEYFNTPIVIQPERMFGFTQRYTKTFRAYTNCNIIYINKSEVMRLTEQYEIFRINMLNTICTKTQRAINYPWKISPQSIRQKIAAFIERRCSMSTGEKRLNIKMETLGHEISESRLNVSRELKAMHEEGIIRLSRGEIHIPTLEKLLL